MRFQIPRGSNSGVIYETVPRFVFLAKPNPRSQSLVCCIFNCVSLISNYFSHHGQLIRRPWHQCLLLGYPTSSSVVGEGGIRSQVEDPPMASVEDLAGVRRCHLRLSQCHKIRLPKGHKNHHKVVLDMMCQ